MKFDWSRERFEEDYFQRHGHEYGEECAYGECDIYDAIVREYIMSMISNRRTDDDPGEGVEVVRVDERYLL